MSPQTLAQQPDNPMENNSPGHVEGVSPRKKFAIPGRPNVEIGDKRELRTTHGMIGYFKELAKRFSDDQCASWAAALSFFGILSIAPMLLCGLAVMGFLIHDPHEVADRFRDIIKHIVPGTAGITAASDLVKDMKIEESARTLLRSRGIAGLLGILSLFWSALQIFVSATAPMNAAFQIRETRGFVKLRLVALGLLFSAGGLFLISLLPTSGAALLDQLSIVELEYPLKPLIAFMFFAVSVAINALMFTILYRYLPSPAAKVSWRSAGTAGTIIAVLWEVAKQGFGLYLTKFAEGSYNKLYGSLGGLVGLIFWIYYSSMILLLGAEIASLHMDMGTPSSPPPVKT